MFIKAHGLNEGKTYLVNLDHVTLIDKDGEAARLYFTSKETLIVAETVDEIAMQLNAVGALL